jgi:hypothetical protein
VSTHIETPHDRVTGIIDERDKLESVVKALQAEGFPEDAVGVVLGEEGLEEIDPDGSRHGLIGRFVRTLQQFGHEGEEYREAAEELEKGHVLVGVTVTQEEEKNRAADTLRAQGARRLRYWGRLGVEELSK